MCHQVTYTSSPAKVKICHCSLKQNTFPLFTLVAERPQQVTSTCYLMNFFMVALLSRCHLSNVWRDCVLRHTQKWDMRWGETGEETSEGLAWTSMHSRTVVLAKLAWADQYCWGPKWHQVHIHAQHMAGDPGAACFYLALCQLAGLIQQCPHRGPEWEVAGEKELRRGSLVQLEDPLLIFTRLCLHTGQMCRGSQASEQRGEAARHSVTQWLGAQGLPWGLQRERGFFQNSYAVCFA